MSVFKVNNPDKIGSFRSVIDVNRYLGIRIGDLKYTTCNSDVNNWLICDGRSLSRTAYSELFSVIGTDFGADNSETFKLPDFRGRVLGGIGSGSGLTSRDLGDSVGAETHTLTTNQIPSHLHTGTTDSNGIHAHGVTDPSHSHTGTTTTNGSHIHSVTDPSHSHTGTTSTDGSHSHTITDPSHAHSYVHYDDEVSGGTHGTPTGDQTGDLVGDTTASSTTGISINSNGSHNHTFTSNTSTTGISIDSNGSHNHTFTSNTSTTGISINSNGAHTHTFTSNNTGGGQSHNNMQPTLFGGNVLILSKVADYNTLPALDLKLLIEY